MDLSEFRELFAAEATKNLTAFEQGLLALEKKTDDREALDNIFRAVHTLKGAGAMVGLPETSRFAHHAETFLDAVRSQTLRLEKSSISLLLSVHDALKALAEEEAAGKIGAKLKSEINSLTASLNQALDGTSDEVQESRFVTTAESPGGTDSADAEEKIYTIEIRCKPETAKQGFDPMSFIRYLRNLGSIRRCQVLHDFRADFDPENLYLSFALELQTAKTEADIREVFSLAGSLIELKVTGAKASGNGINGANAANVPQGPENSEKPTKNPGQKSFLRVESEKLDTLINSIGELVMTGAALRSSQPADADERHRDQISVLERQVETMRESAMQLRTFSLGEIFKKFERVVRDISASLGKEVTLEIRGGETEIDKNLMDGIYDPLVHIVRNSVDHGIESVEERIAKGKPRAGKVTIKAEHHAGMIYISVEDDGSGPDLKKIEKRARERGLLKDGATSEQDLIDMVFQPGFSTAEKITAISGRGVGMDVVRQNVSKLNGTVTMTRGTPYGTVVLIRLPLTLAIMDALVVENTGNRYAIALDQVIECVDQTDFSDQNDGRKMGIFSLRGEALPVVGLGELFKQAGGPGRVVVVVQVGGKRFGIIVDRPWGEAQVVVKSISHIGGIPTIFNGATILGDGRVGLILDLHNLFQYARAVAENTG